jgi:hypothetical protein
MLSSIGRRLSTKDVHDGLILADLVWSSGQNILIADRMIGLSIFAQGVFQVPFFSIVVEEVLKWIMANIAALEERESIKRTTHKV